MLAQEEHLKLYFSLTKCEGDMGYSLVESETNVDQIGATAIESQEHMVGSDGEEKELSGVKTKSQKKSRRNGSLPRMEPVQIGVLPEYIEIEDTDQLYEALLEGNQRN
jgi:hypothetical protein